MGARPFLLIAGWMSIVASLLHIGCIIGGPDWYRFFGAGEAMARAAEAGSPIPAITTFFIAVILAVWAVFAFGAAGIGWRPSLARTALIAISAVLLARSAMAFVPAAWAAEHSAAFIIISSGICFIMGASFAFGTWLAWPQLSQRT